jgi:hypothetical protein
MRCGCKVISETLHVQCKGGGRRCGATEHTAGDVDGWRWDLCTGDGGVPDPRFGGDRGCGGHGRSHEHMGISWVNVGEVRRSDGRGGEVDLWNILAVFHTSVVFGADPDDDSVGVWRKAVVCGRQDRVQEGNAARWMQARTGGAARMARTTRWEREIEGAAVVTWRMRRGNSGLGRVCVAWGEGGGGASGAGVHGSGCCERAWAAGMCRWTCVTRAADTGSRRWDRALGYV